MRVSIDGKLEEIVAFFTNMEERRFDGPCKVKVPLETDGEKIAKDVMSDPWFIRAKEDFDAQQE